MGAGEIFVTSVDREGTRKGFDCELIAEITKRVDIPVIASGGFGSLDHLSQLINIARPTGVAIADSLHYKRYSFEQIRSFCLANGIATRDFKSTTKIGS
jgi:cyclase